MKVKIIELAVCKDVYDDEYECYGFDPGGIYEVVMVYEEVGSMVIINKFGRKIMVYNDEVEACED